MESQLSFFESSYELPEVPRTLQPLKEHKAGSIQYLPGFDPSKVIDFKAAAKALNCGPDRPNNSYEGQSKTVYALKTMDEIDAVTRWLMVNAKPQYVLGFVLGVNIGLRIRELICFRFRDILNEDGSIKFVSDIQDNADAIHAYQTKTNKNRLCFLNDGCCTVIRWYLAQHPRYQLDDFLFPNEQTGGHITADWFRKILKKAAKACGIQQNIGTHSMRKSLGYSLYMQTKDIGIVMRVLGHESPDVTLRYIGITDEAIKGAYHSISMDPVGSIFPQYRR